MSRRRAGTRSRAPTPWFAIWLAWAAGSMVLWMLLTSTVDPPELTVGAGTSIVAALIVHLVCTQGALTFRPRLRWLRLALPIPGRIVGDTVRLTAVLIRHVTGRKRVRGALIAVPFDHGDEDDPEAAARRALATVGISVTPNTYVIGIDKRRDELLGHQLLSDVRSLEKVLGR